LQSNFFLQKACTAAFYVRLKILQEGITANDRHIASNKCHWPQQARHQKPVTLFCESIPFLPAPNGHCGSGATKGVCLLVRKKKTAASFEAAV
jgi:hypothetical protein